MLKATVIGNLGQDPELRYSADGKAVLRMSVAGNYRTREQSGEWVEKTEWVRAVVFGARAESLANLLKKGTKVYVSGPLEARPWTDQAGGIRAGLELRADDVELMSPRQYPTDDARTGPQQDAAGDLTDLPF